MTTMQLELPFMVEDPQLRAARAIEHMGERFEKNRKALHAKNSAMQQKIDALTYEFEAIKAALCKGQMEFKFT
jgi:hypothetical protein